jgi:hypothetical protein
MHIAMKALLRARVIRALLAYGVVYDGFLIIIFLSFVALDLLISHPDFPRSISSIMQGRCNFLGSIEATDQLTWLGKRKGDKMAGIKINYFSEPLSTTINLKKSVRTAQ